MYVVVQFSTCFKMEQFMGHGDCIKSAGSSCVMDGVLGVAGYETEQYVDLNKEWMSSVEGKICLLTILALHSKVQVLGVAINRHCTQQTV